MVSIAGIRSGCPGSIPRLVCFSDLINYQSDQMSDGSHVCLMYECQMYETYHLTLHEAVVGMLSLNPDCIIAP